MAGKAWKDQDWRCEWAWNVAVEKFKVKNGRAPEGKDFGVVGLIARRWLKKHSHEMT